MDFYAEHSWLETSVVKALKGNHPAYSQSFICKAKLLIDLLCHGIKRFLGVF